MNLMFCLLLKGGVGTLKLNKFRIIIGQNYIRSNNLVIADSNPKFEKRHNHIYGTFCRLRLDCQCFRKNQGEKSVNFWNKLSRLYRIAIFTHALMTIQVVVNTYLWYWFEVESPELLVESLKTLWNIYYKGQYIWWPLNWSHNLFQKLLLFKVLIQSVTKAIIFELFYYINDYFRV